jgi:hemolysin activation/secretion protein
MQISEDELFATQSFSIGGQGSVRGFKDVAPSPPFF